MERLEQQGNNSRLDYALDERTYLLRQSRARMTARRREIDGWGKLVLGGAHSRSCVGLGGRFARLISIEGG